jgi:hypothetical protein
MVKNENLLLLESIFGGDSIYTLLDTADPISLPQDPFTHLSFIKMKDDLTPAIDYQLYGRGIRLRWIHKIEKITAELSSTVYRLTLYCINYKKECGGFVLYLHQLRPAKIFAKSNDTDGSLLKHEPYYAFDPAIDLSK